MLIVDAYNALHAWAALGGGPDEPVGKSSTAPLALCRLIRKSRYRRHPVKMVCDGSLPAGPEPDRPPEGHRVVYAGPGVEADALIEDLIEASTTPRRLVVISSDRRIRNAAKARRCQWFTSEGFLKHVVADAQRGRAPVGKPAFTKDVPLRTSALVLWLEEFGFDAESVIREARAQARTKRTKQSSPPFNDSNTPPDAPDSRARTSSTQARPRSRSFANSPEPTPDAAPANDPELEALLNDLSARIDPDDLDMARWLGESD